VKEPPYPLLLRYRLEIQYKEIKKWINKKIITRESSCIFSFGQPDKHLANFLTIIERNQEIVKDKTKKRSITFSQDMPLFCGRLAMKCDDYQPPQAASTGTAYAITVAATTNIPNTIFLIISPP
jgi:hypothetical protein